MYPLHSPIVLNNDFTHFSYTRRSGDGLSLPGALSRDRVSNQRRSAVDQGGLSFSVRWKLRRFYSKKRPRPKTPPTGFPRPLVAQESTTAASTTATPPTASPGGEQPRDGDDRGRPPRARVSLPNRTVTLGVASACVCEHVREAPYLVHPLPRRGGVATAATLCCCRAGCRSSSTCVGAPSTTSWPPSVRLLPPETALTPPPAADHHHIPRHRHAASHQITGVVQRGRIALSACWLRRLLALSGHSPAHLALSGQSPAHWPSLAIHQFRPCLAQSAHHPMVIALHRADASRACSPVCTAVLYRVLHTVLHTCRV